MTNGNIDISTPNTKEQHIESERSIIPYSSFQGKNDEKKGEKVLS